MITTINIVVMYTDRSLLRTEMDYTVKLDFGDDPVRSVDEKLEILKFDYSWADAMEEEDRKNEEKKRMKILCDFKLCDKDNEAGKRKKNIKKDRASLEEFTRDNEAEKRGMENKRLLDVMRAIQAELLAKFKQRDGKIITESITKLENEIDKRQKLANDAWKTEKRESLIKQILVDLVRKIRKRRNPQMARKIMTKLEEHRKKLLKVQEELIQKYVEKEKFHSMKKIYQEEMLRRFKEKEEIQQKKEAYQQELMRRFKEKEDIREKKQTYQQELMRRFKEKEQIREKKETYQQELMRRFKEKEGTRQLKEAYQQELMRRFKEKEVIRQLKEAYQQELMRRFKEKEKIHQIKEAYQQELMRLLKEKEEICQMKKAFQRELMVFHRRKQEDNECFVPRKLFLFNIDTFCCPPIPNCVQQNEKKAEAFKSEERSAPPLKKSLQKKPKQSIKRRLKTWFGGK